MQSPAMAAQLAQTQSIANAQSPEQKERLLKLKQDPDLKAMFDDIESNGAGASQSGPTRLAYGDPILVHIYLKHDNTQQAPGSLWCLRRISPAIHLLSSTWVKSQWVHA